ncbi:THAP domain-containing protein 2-like [Spodoptera litura]|uniref:THAP domain-containing protein 2-like n=1 Tax=Spodoptera litura TaxID=69820 RepID=A0A9J7IP19_SPOLT|nr:THAP domain-containing protein 2-like [Spodoptera litura]
MTRCIVLKCSEIGVHRIPKDNKIRRLWLKAIRREDLIPTNNSRLCRKHFVESDYEKISKYTGVEHQHKYLKKSAVPSVFAWNTQPVSEKAKARQDRLKARNLKKKLLFEMPSTSQSCEDIVPLKRR